MNNKIGTFRIIPQHRMLPVWAVGPIIGFCAGALFGYVLKMFAF